MAGGPEEIVMRSRHVIAVVVVLLVGLGLKMLFFPNRAAEAESQLRTEASMDIFQMHLKHPHIKDLPEQRVEEPF
jgi:hypothetical protein